MKALAAAERAEEGAVVLQVLVVQRQGWASVAVGLGMLCLETACRASPAPSPTDEGTAPHQGTTACLCPVQKGADGLKESRGFALSPRAVLINQ